MKRILSALFGKGAPVTGGSPRAAPAPDDEIPRYPPFAKGLPVAAVERVLTTQQELIDRIRHVLALSGPDFDRFVRPVLHSYAAYVHLLPASELHHHRGAGGLFRHGLEVAFWAAQSAEGVIFSYSSSPREKREQEPRWRLATCLAGLLHDIGKPVSDLAVTSNDGAAVWNPYGETLYKWASTNGIDRYFLRWRDGRHKRHEQFSVLVVDKIVPQETLQWLTQAGPEILQAMLEAISGSDDNHVVSSLVLRADNTSVQRDLKSHQIVQTDGSLGVPVEKYILDAMRRLISSATWLVNQKGARLWILDEGPYVVWKQGAEDITRLLAADRVPGIPRDPDTLADILIERNLAVPQQHTKGMYRYWMVAPDALQQEDGSRVRLSMLRLASTDVLFSTEPPPTTRAIIDLIGEEGTALAPAPAAGEKTAGAEKEAAVPSSKPRSEPRLPSAKAKEPSKQEPTNGDLDDVFRDPAPNASPHDKPRQADPAGAENPAQPPAKPKPAKAPAGNDPFGTGGGNAVDELDRLLGGGDEEKLDEIFNGANRKSPSAKAPKPLAPAAAQPRPPAAATGETWLESLPGEPGDTIRKIAAKLKSHPGLWGTAVGVALDRVVIKYPDGAAEFSEPPFILSMTEQAGVLDLDPATPMRKIRQWGNLKGLVLTAKASAALIALRPGQGKPQRPREEPAQNPHPAVPAPARQPRQSHPDPAPAKAAPKESPPAAKGADPKVADRPKTLPKPPQAKKPAATETPTASAGKASKAKPSAPRIKAGPEVHAVAEQMLSEIRAYTAPARGGIIRSQGNLVVPSSIIHRYARANAVSVWEVRSLIESRDDCELNELSSKLIVKEKP